MALSVKKCVLKDLHELIEISRSTFITAFKKDNNTDDFNAYMNSAFSKERIRSELINPDSTFYFIFLEKELVGYLKLNENNAQSEQFDEPSIELERLYVLNEFQGKQIGKHALLRVLEIAKNKGLRFLWLGVWEHNQDAIRFYKRYGFKRFGSHPYMLGNDKQTDWLMKYELN